jgi:hypothetical protein
LTFSKIPLFILFFSKKRYFHSHFANASSFP